MVIVKSWDQKADVMKKKKWLEGKKVYILVYEDEQE